MWAQEGETLGEGQGRPQEGVQVMPQQGLRSGGQALPGPEQARHTYTHACTHTPVHTHTGSPSPGGSGRPRGAGPTGAVVELVGPAGQVVAPETRPFWAWQRHSLTHQASELAGCPVPPAAQRSTR